MPKQKVVDSASHKAKMFYGDDKKEVKLKPLNLEHQYGYLNTHRLSPAISMNNAVHVIFNNILHMFYGESKLAIHDPCFGDNEIRYLDDKTPECIYNAVNIYINSDVTFASDSHIKGINNFVNSVVIGDESLRCLENTSVEDSRVVTPYLAIKNSTLHGNIFTSPLIDIVGSHCQNSTLNTMGSIVIKHSRRIESLTVGGCAHHDGKNKPVKTIHIESFFPISAENIPPSLIFSDEAALFINSQFDISVIVTLDGQKLSTIRGEKKTLYVSGYRFCSHETNFEEKCYYILGFNDKLPLSYSEEAILDDLVSSIKSRLRLFQIAVNSNEFNTFS